MVLKFANFFRNVTIRTVLFLHFLVFFNPLSAQNLVSNPSFESYTSCPDEFFQIYKAPTWFSPDCGDYYPNHGYAILLNSCNYGIVSVPNNVICTQSAHKGAAYAAIEVVSGYKSVYRQYIETMLTAPLVKDKKYYFSSYFNLCDQFAGQPNHDICYNADSTGVVFSRTKIDVNPGCLPVPLKPDIHATLPRIKQSSEWNIIDGCYTATGEEQYIIMGNFGSEAISTCATVDSLSYFIFIDDVSLIPEINKVYDTTLCTSEPWKLDATSLREEYKTMPGWTYLWSNGDTSSKHVFSQPESLKLTVSQKDCFNDEYNFNVKFVDECDCQIFAPGAFTPNGDRLNDIYLPRMACPTGEMSNYSLSIYNRWGERVFYTNEKNRGWDGMYKGSIVQNEVFAWLIKYDLKKGERIEHKKSTGTLATIK